MIASLTGQLISKAPSQITLDVNGVGYEVLIPLSTFFSLPDLQQPLALNIHTHLQSDTIRLFGFLTSLEKEAFVLLTGIAGIGPKLALSVLSTFSVVDFIHAIQSDDIEKLTAVPGIGKKSAGRIVLELADKVSRLQFPDHSPTQPSHLIEQDQVEEDTLSALVNLGYRSSEVRAAMKRIEQQYAEPKQLPQFIRETLKELSGK